MSELSIADAFAGKRVLITGASGFLGKVWLASLLLEVPQVEQLIVLLRPGRKGARRRFEDLIATCPSFAPLHDRFGDELPRVIAEKVLIVAGDLSLPLLGLDPEVLKRLAGIDLVVNLAGHTDLEPDLRDALATNVDGALHALDVARQTGAKLLHVSTAYVAGARGGVVPEEVLLDCAPSGDTFDAARELADLRELIARIERSADDQHVVVGLRAKARAQIERHGATQSPRVEAEFLARERAHWVHEQLDALARERATAWGWPNVYTLTKSLAESLLARVRGDVPTWIVRPTIVESALGFPFPGWKEGLHTSGPLVYALTNGPLRGLPARDRLVLDVIPVDFVAKGLTVVAAATLSDAARELRVFQLGSSERNPLPMKRVVELSSLAKRKHSRQEASEHQGKLRLREVFAADAVATSRRVYEATSIPLFRRLARGAAELLEAAAEVLPASVGERSREAARSVDRAERKLQTLEGVVDRFVPFVLENDCVFAAQGIRELEARLPADERGFIADPASIDWRSYWIDVHVPGLRRWVFPRIEGRRLSPLPRREFKLEPERGAVEAS